MGKFAPVFLAFLLNCFGVNVFRENAPGCEPLLSSLIFLFSVFILLWDLRLYPSSLRRLWKQGSYVVEFLIAVFLMEHIMTDFWYPLEASIAAFLPKIAQFETDILKQGGWDCGGIFAFLQWDGTLVVASYIMSLFFLCAVLHATRIVDFRLLSSGPAVFFKDLLNRAKKCKKRLLRICSMRKRGRFNKSKGKSRSRLTTCPSSENCNSFDGSDDEDCTNCGEEEDEYSPYVTKKFQ